MGVQDILKPFSQIRFDNNRWSIHAKDLTLTNFPGLPHASVARISSLYLELDPMGFLTGELRINELDVQMGSLMIPRTNGDTAHVVIPFPTILTKLVIDNLKLKLDRLILEREATKDNRATTESKNVHLRAHYRDVSDYAEFSRDIEGKLRRRIMRNAVRDADPFGVAQVVETVYKSSKWTVTEVAQLGLRIFF